MGYAKYIGRVGALAVTLGVGVAVATSPGFAYAEDTDTTSSASESPSTGAGDPDTDTDDAAVAGAVAGPTSPTGDDSTGSDAGEEEAAEDDDLDLDLDDETDLGDDEPVEEEPVEEEPVEEEPADESGVVDTGDSEAPEQPETDNDELTTPEPATDNEAPHEELEDETPATQDDLTFTAFAAAAAPSDEQEAPEAFRTATVTTPSIPAPVLQPIEALVNLVNEVVSAIFTPILGPGNWSPFNGTLLTGLLSLVRNEFERVTATRSQYTVMQIAGPSLLADPNPNVLVIGVDGANLSRILADPELDAFFALMDDGTTAASSIAGHTTLSNPSWTAILTGAWGEKTGVINNIWTPWTYNRFPTVFTMLEANVPGIVTTNIADWDVINAIAGTGEYYVDTNIFIPHQANDPYWHATDDLVGQATVDAINDTPTGVPTFMFTYFVGVDENGHSYGGGSEEYKLALQNVNDNIKDILGAIEAWEAANPDEGEWTVIVVTDHGHTTQQGFGHGFQTPNETSTFVIASGPGFEKGWVNPTYEIVDTTPTVLTLFGVPVPGYSDGESLTLKHGSDLQPADLQQALKDMIATNHEPGLITTVALGARTIFASIPYFIMDFTVGTPFAFLGDILYVPTNFVAQIVALLTGVRGASIFPILPPPAPNWPPDAEQQQATVLVFACRSGEFSEGACSASSVA
jgi:hypothetical protein